MRTNSGPGPMGGFLLGAAGAVAGLAAMRCYWRQVAPAINATQDRLPPSRKTQAHEGAGHPLDDISLVGRHHRGDESSTAALGRIAYREVTGEAPDGRTHTRLSFGVHWVFGLFVGGLYGMARRRAAFPDLAGGLAFATGVWLLGDELAVPLLGLQGGPTAASPAAHANRLGAHLAFGVATAATTQALRAGTAAIGGAAGDDG